MDSRRGLDLTMMASAGTRCTPTGSRTQVINTAQTQRKNISPRTTTRCITTCGPSLGSYSSYMYSSTFKPQPPRGRPKYRSGADRPKNTGDFYNVMWDPRVYRGSTFKTFQTVEKERCAAVSKRKYKPPKLRPTFFDLLRRPETPPDPCMVVSIHGGGQISFEKYLEETVEAGPEANTIETQTDLINPKPRPPGPVVAKIGYDSSTSIGCEDLFTFDQEIEPIAQTLASKVFQQALLETLEEEVMADLRDQINEHRERWRQQQLEHYVHRMHERDFYDEQVELVKQYMKEITEEQELQEQVCVRQFSRSYLTNLIPKLLITLENEGFISKSHLGEIYDSLEPWLTKEVLGEINTTRVTRAVLDEIIQDVSDDREAQVGSSVNVYNESRHRDSNYLHPESEGE